MKKVIKSIFKTLGYDFVKIGFSPTGYNLKSDLSKHIPSKRVKTVFDIGANIGEFSLSYSKDFESAAIYSFEPVKSTFEKLKENTNLNSNIQCFNFGLGAKEEEIKLYHQIDSGLNSVNPNVNLPVKTNQNSHETIKLKTIDSFCLENSISEIDFLKTDTEGLDIEVLKGGLNMINKGKIKAVFSEVGFHADNSRNTSFYELQEFLYSKNYKLRSFYDQSNFGDKSYMTCANALFLLQP